MKERLSELTVTEFVELICGDVSVLKSSPHEILDPKKVKIAARDIALEFKDISDRASMRSYLSQMEESAKLRLQILAYGIAADLSAIGSYDKAREVLSEHGINAGRMSDSRIEAESRSQLERAKGKLRRLLEESVDDKDIDVRREFSAQSASLMAYFKFQIDPDRMKADLYAHLISRHNAEIKAKLAALKKK